jgi:hypothetical protein
MCQPYPRTRQSSAADKDPGQAEEGEGRVVSGWREALAEISVFYQPTDDGRAAAHGLRAAAGATGAACVVA